MASIIAETTGELREDIPLKSGTKHSSLCSCNEHLFGGSRLITTAFAVLTVIITIALLIQIYYGDFQVAPHGSVATDDRECSEIGTYILKQGGNAVDAAVAAAFCLCVTNPHTVGLDGTGEILVYNHKTHKNPEVVSFSTIQTPKLVTSLAYVHDNFGILPWKDCVMPSANLARKGFFVSKQLATVIKKVHAEDLFGPLEAGIKINLTALADTLTRIAEVSQKEFLSENATQVKNQSISNSTFANFNVYVPKSAPGLQFLSLLQEIEDLNITNNTSKPEYVYKLTTAIKNLNFSAVYHEGTTANVAVIDQDDFYVSLVIGMSAPFGLRKMTPDGYLLDVSDLNQPYSRIPIIATDANFRCGKRLVLGVSDAAIAGQVLTNLLIFGENITSGVEFPRFSFLEDGTIGLEEIHRPVFSDAVINQLEKVATLQTLKEPYDSCNIVEKYLDEMNSHSDSRGGGISSRF